MIKFYKNILILVFSFYFACCSYASSNHNVNSALLNKIDDTISFIQEYNFDTSSNHKTDLLNNIPPEEQNKISQKNISLNETDKKICLSLTAHQNDLLNEIVGFLEYLKEIDCYKGSLLKYFKEIYGTCGGFVLCSIFYNFSKIPDDQSYLDYTKNQFKQGWVGLEKLSLNKNFSYYNTEWCELENTFTFIRFLHNFHEIATDKINYKSKICSTFGLKEIFKTDQYVYDKPTLTKRLEKLIDFTRINLPNRDVFIILNRYKHKEDWHSMLLRKDTQNNIIFFNSMPSYGKNCETKIKSIDHLINLIWKYTDSTLYGLILNEDNERYIDNTYKELKISCYISKDIDINLYPKYNDTYVDKLLMSLDQNIQNIKITDKTDPTLMYILELYQPGTLLREKINLKTKILLFKNLLKNNLTFLCTEEVKSWKNILSFNHKLFVLSNFPGNFKLANFLFPVNYNKDNDESEKLDFDNLFNIFKKNIEYEYFDYLVKILKILNNKNSEKLKSFLFDFFDKKIKSPNKKKKLSQQQDHFKELVLDFYRYKENKNIKSVIESNSLLNYFQTIILFCPDILENKYFQKIYLKYIVFTNFLEKESDIEYQNELLKYAKYLDITQLVQISLACFHKVVLSDKIFELRAVKQKDLIKALLTIKEFYSNSKEKYIEDTKLMLLNIIDNFRQDINYNWLYEKQSEIESCSNIDQIINLLKKS